MVFVLIFFFFFSRIWHPPRNTCASRRDHQHHTRPTRSSSPPTPTPTSSWTPSRLTRGPSPPYPTAPLPGTLTARHWAPLAEHEARTKSAAKCTAWSTETSGAPSANGKRPAADSVTENRRTFKFRNRSMLRNQYFTRTRLIGYRSALFLVNLYVKCTWLKCNG